MDRHELPYTYRGRRGRLRGENMAGEVRIYGALSPRSASWEITMLNTECHKLKASHLWELTSQTPIGSDVTASYSSMETFICSHMYTALWREEEGAQRMVPANKGANLSAERFGNHQQLHTIEWIS